jgi:SNF2 family DNA or RNA helicase
MRDFLVGHERAGGFVSVGLGKTASTLSAFHQLYCEGAARAMLVVAPLRVANLTWPNEIRKWDQFRGFKVEKLRGPAIRPSGEAQIYVTNYEQLGNLRGLDFCDTVVFDELTRAKSPSSERINALRPLLRGQRRWGLTGTPRPNSLLELFAQIRLLDDGKRLGHSFDMFRKTWFEPEDWNEYRWNPKPDAERRIYEKIHDLVITLRASDYLDIPDTIVEDINVPLPKAAHGLYRELEKELMAAIGTTGEVVIAINAAVLVNKLLQICGGSIYTGTPEDRRTTHIHEAKIGALKKLMVDIGDEQVLIASNYIHERERVCAAIPGAVDASKFTGDIEDAWNSGRIKVLVADPRSLGHGLNLQAGGRTVVWFSPTWSRELYDQFNGRVARKGQTGVPRIYRLVCPGTIDDVVIETLRVRGEGQGVMLELLTNFRQQGMTFAKAA